VDPSTVTAGRTLVVETTGPAPRRAAVLYNGRRILFFNQPDGSARARVGISTLEDAGARTLTVRWPPGASAAVPFWVQAGTFPVSRLTLKPDREKLVTSGRMDRDAAHLARVYRRPMGTEKLWDGHFVLPSTGVFTTVFGARRDYGDGKITGSHSGQDIANSAGAFVRAPAGGWVVYARRLDSFGWTVLLDHGQGVFTYYLHMRALDVSIGARVKTGDLLGRMGAEGVATGSHVHWSLVVSGERVDPLEWVERAVP
jgi:murein DD-endopeptidase MepM/ murein hydrolase activator NlpD